jgi:histidinol phosphatase-like PHP family hydrolase
MKAIFHIHTKYSFDSIFSPKKIVDLFSFRFGTSFPFHPIINGNLEIYEVPLNIMDSSITSYKVLKAYLEKILEILKSTRGVLVVNWHPNRFNEKEFGNLYKKCFKFLLSKSKENKAWLTSIRNLINEVG